MTILILKGKVKSEHYWAYNSTFPSHVTRVFHRVSAQVTIQAAIYSATGTCNDPDVCYTLSSDGTLATKPLIMWKNPDLRIYVTRSLTLKNIILDGADIVTYSGSITAGKLAVLHPNATSVKARYCLDESTLDNISLTPNPDYPESTLFVPTGI